MEHKVNTHIPVIFQELEEFKNEDIRFIKVKIWLMHTGVNLNGSSFSKVATERAIPTLSNTPILAFIEENSNGELDYSDHRMVLHRKEDGELTVKYLGQAIGVIPETNNAHWEKRVTDSGEEKEYLVVEGLMWTKWDEPLDIMKKKRFTSQSMELSEQYTGHFDENGIFHFDSFSFFGACLLGDDVLPAMVNSTVEVQFSENKTIQNNIENKLNEFYTLFSQEGGKRVEDVKQEFEEVAVTTETEVVETVEEQVEVVIEDTVETEETFEQVETVEVVEETKEEEIEVETVEDVVEETFSKEFVEGLNSQIETLSTEVNSLKAYKRQREEQDLRDKFSHQVSEDEFKQLFSEEVSLEEIETKIYALIGKKNFSLSEEKPSNKIAIKVNKDVKKDNPYADFFN